MKKLIVLDIVTQNTYIMPYDTAVFEDAIECILATSEHHGLDIPINECQWMECEQPNIVVL